MKEPIDLLLIGNGFDLHYNLPTTYTCFLDVLECIRVRIEQGEEVNSVAQVLGDHRLEKNGAIKRCRQRYGDNYDAVIESDSLDQLVACATKNQWFRYFLSASLENDNWVDFEQEIKGVCKEFAVLFQSIKSGDDNLLQLKSEVEYAWSICSQFPFFFDKEAVDKRLKQGIDVFLLDCVDPNYVHKLPSQVDVFCLDCKRIVNDLSKSLRELADTLSLYLTQFVDWPVKNYVDKGNPFYDKFLDDRNWNHTKVVSLNYTHTLAYLGQLPKRILEMFFIHGELRNSRIVLGINADEKDDIGFMDLTFLPFKKYSQRVYYNTDKIYLSFVSQVRDRVNGYIINTLYVIGHSLDSTDKEIITECFDYARNIIVFFHEETEVAKYIHNLVSIYGKQKFDELRLEKNLTFIPIEEMQLGSAEFEKKYN